MTLDVHHPTCDGGFPPGSLRVTNHTMSELSDSIYCKQMANAKCSHQRRISFRFILNLPVLIQQVIALETLLLYRISIIAVPGKILSPFLHWFSILRSPELVSFKNFHLKPPQLLFLPRAQAETPVCHKPSSLSTSLVDG